VNLSLHIYTATIILSSLVSFTMGLWLGGKIWKDLFIDNRKGYEELIQSYKQLVKDILDNTRDKTQS
jgi:hypothetical protein